MKSADGGSIGTDGKVVEVRYSYIDWAIPETDVLVRMGLQPFVKPGFVRAVSEAPIESLQPPALPGGAAAQIGG